MKRRSFLMRLAIGAGIIKVTPAPAGGFTSAEFGEMVEKVFPKSPPPFDPWQGITTFLRDKSDGSGVSNAKSLEDVVEEAPIEEHPKFDELCRVSAFQRERAQRLGILPEGVSGDVSASAEAPKGIS